MSKYGFSITIMLAELFIVFGLFLYLASETNCLDYPSHFSEFSDHCIDCPIDL